MKTSIPDTDRDRNDDQVKKIVIIVESIVENESYVNSNYEITLPEIHFTKSVYTFDTIRIRNYVNSCSNIRENFLAAKCIEILHPANNSHTNPPPIAEWVLMLFSGRKTSCSAVVGDMEELFHHNVRTIGVIRAKRIYWAQALRSFGPLAWRALQRLGLAAAAFAGAKKWLGL